MTPNECARLQSLDGLQLPPTETRAFKALGNAVNAKLVQHVAEQLIGEQSLIVPPGNNRSITRAGALVRA